MGKFCQIFTELSARDTTMAGYYCLMFLFESDLCPHHLSVLIFRVNMSLLAHWLLFKQTLCFSGLWTNKSYLLCWFYFGI